MYTFINYIFVINCWCCADLLAFGFFWLVHKCADNDVLGIGTDDG